MILMVQFVAHTVKHALHLPTVGLATRTIRHPATHAVIITGGSAAARAISLLLAPPHSGVLWLYVRDRVAIRAIATGMYGTLVHTIPWWILWQTAWGGGYVLLRGFFFLLLGSWFPGSEGFVSYF